MFVLIAVMCFVKLVVFFAPVTDVLWSSSALRSDRGEVVIVFLGCLDTDCCRSTKAILPPVHS